MQTTTVPLDSQALEKHCIAPFIRKHFPFLESLRPQVALVRSEHNLLKPTPGERPLCLPAQYSYTFTYRDDDFEQVIHIVATADGNILRVLVSR